MSLDSGKTHIHTLLRKDSSSERERERVKKEQWPCLRLHYIFLQVKGTTTVHDPNVTMHTTIIVHQNTNATNFWVSGNECKIPAVSRDLELITVWTANRTVIYTQLQLKLSTLATATQ